jgi:hypothetical protein
MDLGSATLGESIADEAERDADDEEREPGSVVIHQASNRNWRPSAMQPCPVREVLPIHAGHHSTGRLAALSLRQPSDLRGDAARNASRAYLDLLFGVKSRA